MTRQEAIDLFGSAAKLAKALGITRAAIYQWPEELDKRRANEVTGAAYRAGLLE